MAELGDGSLLKSTGGSEAMPRAEMPNKQWGIERGNRIPARYLDEDANSVVGAYSKVVALVIVNQRTNCPGAQSMLCR